MRTTTIGRWAPVIVLGLLLTVLAAPGSEAAPGAGSPIAGRVTDVHGAPLAGITVKGMREVTETDWEPYELGETDADGHYSGELPAGTYRLHFRDPDDQFVPEFWGGANYYDEAATFEVDGVAPVPAKDVVLDTYAVITGTVTSTFPGEQTDARATVYRKEGDSWRQAYRSSIELDPPPGRYVVRNVAPGVYRVRLGGGPYFDAFWGGATTVEAATDVVVTGGSVVDGIDATLVPQGRIVGRVTNVAGEGVPEYRVQAIGLGDLGGARFYGYTDSDGYYVVSPVYAGSYELSFSKLGGPCQSAQLEEEVVVPLDEARTTTTVTAPDQELSCRLTTVGQLQTFGFNPAFVGRPVGIVPPEWTISDAQVSYQWYATGVGPIPGATNWWYVPTYPHSSLLLEVTATRPGVDPARLTFETPVYPGSIQAKAMPRIKGTTRVGSTLRVTRGKWNAPDIRMKLTWLADGRPIRGAHDRRLTLLPRHVGKRIRVKLKLTVPDNAYMPKVVRTKATRPVTR